ncbi:Glycolipid 2-alpha-mannosyltransferase 1 [Neolecta irregularis DAH-3]|uniref:Glycolipid 2-alpha-mannosyltransferase 1 n=1 Tax=Neolecta irregularis (strain DAH-3) TaxID=1198029 RepID=A0A1U7LKY8_NEOID|nr:Glycolipid 2-alpha-mannosyltransferase 1 [Neolecta irregularis DAH-3]|eukprot:OLL23326.1 Glycolipid 2-alpha-mannosyltransferase 1 [Neolecta irregularis DAH-3]
MEFITPDNGKSYNRCHFWSNFEIANLNFWRNSSYNAYFNHLDRAGGFFYERWGDAPVHTIAAVMFLKPEQIHFFNDIGYYHIPFTHCPIEDEFRQKCHCSPHDSFDWKDHSCTKRWFKTAGNKLPEHHAKYAG